MAVYLTGDCHAEFGKFSTKRFPEQKELTRDDYVIVCGDFGLWHDCPEERHNLDWLASKPFTLLFVDGNHECLHKNTEILTNEGWINIVDIYNNIDKYLVAAVDLETHKMSYSKPLNRIKKYAEKLIYFRGSNYRQCVTHGHDILINGKKVKAEQALSMDIREHDFRFEINNNDEGVNIPNEIIEVLTMIIMDGTIVDEKKYNPNSNKLRIQFHLKKLRKIIYLQNLLDSNNIKYTITQSSDNTTYIRIYGDYARELYSLLDREKQIPNYWKNLNESQFRYLMNGLVNSDGTSVNNTIKWRTTSLKNVDIITELCIKHNYDIKVQKLEKCSGYTDYGMTQYDISIGKLKKIDHKIKIEEIDYYDDVYCLTMQNGTLITRYELTPCITGNCFDRLKNEFPVVDFHGGKAHKIRENVYHLMRGYVFDLCGKKFFAFGGCKQSRYSRWYFVL